jgi:TatA/E family protein of Tat protein translocase
MFGSLGFTELFFIFIIALIIFGPRKLPELGKTLGNALGQFKRASEDFKRSWEDEVELEKRRPIEPKPASNAVARIETLPADAAHATLPAAEDTPAPAEQSADPAV